MSATEDQFTREAAGLPEVRATEVVGLSDGDTFELELAPVRNPGVWMAHCHIAEHHESGMMLNFNVAPAGDAR